MSKKPAHRVLRLANAPAGEPYRLQAAAFESAREAADRAAHWWSSGGTVALVVYEGDREDARYVRPWTDAGRVPEDWPAARARPVTDATTAPRTWRPPAPEAAAPTLGSDAEEEAPPGPLGLCHECRRPLLPDGRYEGDTDTTPSGRINEGRCAGCGHPEPGLRHSAIQRRHVAAACRS